MTRHASQQLDAIHSMLSAGHRNLCVERHSLVLWGATFGCLILASTHILTAEQYPELHQRALAWLVLLVLTLSGVSLLDWHLTRNAKQARDEAWSFIHRQVLKVWWLLMSMGVLLTFATFFYGGSYMIFAAWLVLAGIGLYVHGLFSEELLEWTGALIIAIGICALAFRLKIDEMRWVAASTLGLGLPLLAAMLDRGRQRPAMLRLGQSLAWLLLVLAPPLLAQRYAEAQAAPDAPLTSLEQFRATPDMRQIVELPAGSTIPVQVEIGGDVFRPSTVSVLPLVLDRPVQMLMEHGQPSGVWRKAGMDWASAGDNSMWITIPWIKAEIDTQQGPQVRARLIVETRHAPTN